MKQFTNNEKEITMEHEKEIKGVMDQLKNSIDVLNQLIPQKEEAENSQSTREKWEVSALLKAKDTLKKIEALKQKMNKEWVLWGIHLDRIDNSPKQKRELWKASKAWWEADVYLLQWMKLTETELQLWEKEMKNGRS